MKLSCLTRRKIFSFLQFLHNTLIEKIIIFVIDYTSWFLCFLNDISVLLHKILIWTHVYSINIIRNVYCIYTSYRSGRCIFLKWHIHFIVAYHAQWVCSMHLIDMAYKCVTYKSNGPIRQRSKMEALKAEFRIIVP